MQKNLISGIDPLDLVKHLGLAVQVVDELRDVG